MVKIPAIIDDETFKNVQIILEKRANKRIRGSKYKFLCTGLIRCVRCGRLYGGRNQRDWRTGKDYLLYRCPQTHTVSFNEPICKSRTIARNKIENIVWQYVSSLITNKEKIKARIREVKERREKEKLSNQKIYDGLLVEKNELKLKKAKLLELYSNNNILVDDLNLKMNDFNEKEKLLDSQLINVKREIDGIEDMNLVEREIEKMCQVYQGKIDNPTFEIKKAIVKRWIEEINIQDDGQIRLKVRVPEGEDFAYIDANNTLHVTELRSQRSKKIIHL